jgi:Acetylglutamate synthase
VILTKEDAGIYLDKFAVLDDAQGEGLGRAVWQVMREQVPRLFWRSRHGNPVNAFYFAECDGCIKQPRWKVFWYGFVELADIGRCIEHCRTRPATLAEPSVQLEQA